jgi:Flp pilus assembly protein TadG
MGKREGIVRARRGAVLAEFAIAFMPICTMFLCVAQFSRYMVARMAVMHAAEVAVRACAVTLDPNPGTESQLNGSDTDYQTAADMVLKSNPLNPIQQWTGFVGATSELQYSPANCTVQASPPNTNGGTDTVTIDATFTCGVPVAQRIICSGGPKTFTMTAQFPHQGAEYVL